MTATNALGVWTSADCALVLIDFQKEMFQSIRGPGAREPACRQGDAALAPSNRRHRSYDGSGGDAEQGENMVETALREVLEESERL